MDEGEPEKLDFDCYQKMDETLLSQGNREVLGLA